MATKELAAMLDELMGRNRNAGPDEKIPDMTWEDQAVCRYHLVNFCPHDLFTNTKADLGTCPKIHDDDMKRAYMEAPDGYKKQQCQDDFLRFSQKMLSDLGNKIKSKFLSSPFSESATSNNVIYILRSERETAINPDGAGGR